MGRTIVTIAGWGVVLKEKQQKNLEKEFIKHLKKIHLSNPFRDSPWFPYDEESFFLFDALEEYYENTLSIQGGEEQGLFILAKSTSLTSYDGELVKTKNLNITPNEAEIKNLDFIIEKSKYTKKPTWVMKTFIY